LAIKKWGRFGKITFILKNSGGVLTCIHAHIANLRTTTLGKVFLFVNDDDVKKKN